MKKSISKLLIILSVLVILGAFWANVFFDMSANLWIALLVTSIVCGVSGFLIGLAKVFWD